VYAHCPTWHGSRYNARTLEVKYRGKNMADVLGMAVDEAWAFFVEEESGRRSLEMVRSVGVGYLRLGQLATESPGEGVAAN
jgi:excinuclease ABC subunit A